MTLKRLRLRPLVENLLKSSDRLVDWSLIIANWVFIRIIGCHLSEKCCPLNILFI
jgi:hypothetical protein